MHLNYPIDTCGDGGVAFHKKPDGQINVKVEFGEDEIKVHIGILLKEQNRTSLKSE